MRPGSVYTFLAGVRSLTFVPQLYPREPTADLAKKLNNPAASLISVPAPITSKEERS